MNAATSWLEGLPPLPEKWRAFLLGSGPRLATWVLAIALGIQAAVILTAVASQWKGPRALNVVPPPIAAQQAIDVSAIINSHPFGEAPAAPQQDAANAPPSNIPLVLTGIIAQNDPQNGLAILGQNPNNAKVYAVGDNVPGGAKVHLVYNDRVIIDRNGHLESLVLPRQYQPNNARPPSASALRMEAPIVDRMRKIINDDPALLADILKPQPVFAEGKQRGYRVYPGRNRQAFTKLGLRPGDLVTAINGTSLDDPSHAQEIFQTLGSSSEAHVTVMRNGQQQDVVLNLAQVTSEAESLSSDQPGVQASGAPPGEGQPPQPPPEGTPPPESTQ